MTASKHLIAMIHSHAAGDDQKFLSIAEHIADDAGRSGQTKVAAEIRSLVANVRIEARKVPAAPISIATPRGELAGLIGSRYPEARLADLVLSKEHSRRVQRLVLEHRERALLEENGLAPRRKFLFWGPPGTGKGMTAAALAGELGLPLFTILLDGVITKFMGETASKLRLIFESMNSVRGIYFFDEVDALASRRDVDNDVGEARRMLNSFLQFLEDDHSNSLIIAATNNRGLLDPAVFRRSHAALEYAKPTADEAKMILVKRLTKFDIRRVDWSEVEPAFADLSQADLVAAADDAAREAVLVKAKRISAEILVEALRDRAKIRPL